MRHLRAVPLIFLALGLFACGLVSGFAISRQEEEEKVSNEISSADVGSIDAIVTALYDVISGPAGERDWDRMRTLFSPGARLIPIRIREEGGAEARVSSVDDYIENAGPYFRENNFYETEIARATESFGNLAHVFSTYESRRSPGEAPFTRGINSIQLLKDGDRWRIVTIFWDSERSGERIPARYLP